MAFNPQEPRRDFRDQQRPYQQRPQYPRNDQRGFQQRPYNGGGQRPPRPQGNWNNQRPNNFNSRPQRPHKAQPGNGNPKTNYLNIAAGTKFVLRPMQQQVKIFATDSYEELEFAVNQWIAEEKYGEIIDMKFQTAAYYGCSVCIIYRPKITEDMVVTFTPKKLKAAAPAETAPTTSASVENATESSTMVPHVTGGAPADGGTKMTGAPDCE